MIKTDIKVDHQTNLRKAMKMTKEQFLDECGAYGVDPMIALSDDRILDALKAGDGATVIAILIEDY